MKTRQILVTTLILATVWHTAAAQPKKKNVQTDAPRPESILAGTSMQSSPALSDLIAIKPEMPLGPQDVLKSYEIGMSLVADKTSADFSVIVQAQQTNQITREQAEYLLQQRYQLAMMQYQVLSALHDVLKHDIDEAAGQQARQSLKATSSDTVLVVPFPDATLHPGDSASALKAQQSIHLLDGQLSLAPPARPGWTGHRDKYNLRSFDASGRLSVELTSSAHIRSLSLSSARVGAPTIYTLAILTHLEALTPGTRIAIPSIDPEFTRRRTTINIVLEGT